MQLPMRETMMHAAGVYAIVNTATGDFYIGSTVAFGKRCRAHRAHLNRGDHPNVHLARAWQKYGAAAFDFVPVAVLAPDEVGAYEQRMLDRLVGHPRCYNVARDVEASTRGIPNTEAQKAATSARFRGVPKSPEHRARIAAALRGKARSPEHAAKIGEANRRRPPASDETRAKMSAAHQGLPGPMAGRTHTPEAKAKISAANRLRRAMRHEGAV